jgi:A nuclease of the HNH/ENDO VII superfamily with conserved WHH
LPSTYNNIEIPNTLATGVYLATGDKFTAGDYEVVVTEITSGSATAWNGKGYVTFKFIGGIKVNKVAVKFENIVVNECYQLSGGKVITEYDANWGNVLDVDGLISDLEDILKELRELILGFDGSDKQKTDLIKQAALINSVYSKIEGADLLHTSLLSLSNTNCSSSENNNSARFSNTLSVCQVKKDEAVVAYDSFLNGLLNAPPTVVDEKISGNLPPNVTKADLYHCIEPNPVPPYTCNYNNIIKAYYGFLYQNKQNPLSASSSDVEFWKIKIGAEVYWITREQILSTYRFLYCPNSERVNNTCPYKPFEPEKGQGLGDQFVDAANETVFTIGVIIATGGLAELGVGASLDVRLLTETIDIAINSLAENITDDVKLEDALKENVFWSSFGYTGDAIKGLKKLSAWSGVSKSVMAGKVRFAWDNMKTNLTPIIDKARSEKAKWFAYLTIKKGQGLFTKNQWTSYVAAKYPSFKTYLNRNPFEFDATKRISAEWDNIRAKYSQHFVKYDCFGFPDFYPFVLNQIGGVAVQCMVKITMEGNSADFTKANEELAKKMNIPYTGQSFQGPRDGIRYTWHHHQDGKHMLLVPTNLNDVIIGAKHAGAVSLMKNFKDNDLELSDGFFDDPVTQNKLINRPCN